MAENEDRTWLLQPAGADEARIHIEIGPEAQLKPEVREALEALAEALMEEDEVSGFAASTCPTLGCNLRCNPYEAKRSLGAIGSAAISCPLLMGGGFGLNARIRT